MSLKKIFSLSVVISLVGILIFQSAESGPVSAATASDTVVVTLNVETGITITSPADTTMSTNLGVSSDTAVATTTWNVKTNNATGYTLTLNATTSPAMRNGTNSIRDYATTSMPSAWTVSAGDARFGFSVFGTDVNSTTWGTSQLCNGAASSSIPSSNRNYYGFYTVATTVAVRASTTTTAGVDTTVCYAVEQDTFYVPSGVYQASIVATATTN